MADANTIAASRERATCSTPKAPPTFAERWLAPVLNYDPSPQVREAAE